MLTEGQDSSHRLQTFRSPLQRLQSILIPNSVLGLPP